MNNVTEASVSQAVQLTSKVWEAFINVTLIDGDDTSNDPACVAVMMALKSLTDFRVTDALAQLAPAVSLDEVWQPMHDALKKLNDWLTS